MKKIRLRIPGSLGSALGAELDLPSQGKPHAWALFAHCFTCSRNLKAFHIICEHLAQNGIAVLRFDFTGIGDSDGDFSQTNFATDVDDIVAVSEYMAANYTAPELLIGHSMGGTAMLHAAARIPSCQSAVTIAAPADPGYVARHYIGLRPEVNKFGSAKMTIGGNYFTVKEKFFADLDYPDDGSYLKHFQKPLLICHSLDDDMLDHDHAEQLHIHAGKPSSLVSLDNADHLLSNKDDAGYVADLIAGWAKRYIP